MARAAFIGTSILNYETTDNPRLVYFTLPVNIMATEVGRIDADIRVLHDLDGTTTSWENARRDAFIAQAASINPLLANWSPNDVYQAQIRRA